MAQPARILIRASITSIIALFLASFQTSSMVSLPPPSDAPVLNAVPAPAYTPHPPIDIRENRRFSPSQGVIGGSGTDTDPFIIEGWAIDAPSDQGIRIRNTDAHFIIRNVSIRTEHVGIALSNVANGVIENVSVPVSLGGMGFGAVTNVVVRNSNISSDYYGVFIGTSSNVTVHNNVLWNSTEGIVVERSANITISELTLTGAVAPPISLLRARNLTLANNDGGRITIHDSLGIEMTNNRFSVPGLLLIGTSLPHFNSHTITADNLIDGMPLSYTKDCDGVDLNGADVAQVVVANCRNVRIANLTFSHRTTGIQLAFVSDATIENATFGPTGSAAVDVFQSSLITIVRNTIHDSPAGIRVRDSESVSIARNTVAGNGFGIRATDSSYLLIANNTLYDNGRAVLLDVSGLPTPDFGWVTLVGNLIYFNGRGIDLAGVKRVLIISNRIVNNADGVLVTFQASGVTAYHNDFVGGGVQVGLDFRELDNVWDAGWPIGGNYWSSYTGTDECSGVRQDACPDPDGLGDTPFFIGVNDVDRYPLIRPYNSQNTAPVASFVISPEAGGNATTFTMNASASHDLEDPSGVLQVRWDWENDGVWDTGWSTDKIIHHRWPEPGTYTIRMQVRDAEGLFNLSTSEVFVCFSPDCTSPDPLVIGILIGGAAGGLLFLSVIARRRDLREKRSP